MKNQLEKPGLDKRRMRVLYDEMFSSLCDSRAIGFGSFRKKFIQVTRCSVIGYIHRGGGSLV